MKLKAALAATAAMSTCMIASPAQAGVDPFIGEITAYGFNFCPRGWAAADGQILPIAQYQALFSLYGTTYGGDGRTTFALPDLRGRVPVHVGTGPGLSTYRLGQRGGTETNTLNVSQLPTHNHTVTVNTTAAADSGNPNGNHLARSSTLIYEDTEGATPGATMAADTVGLAGGNQPVNNIQPFQTVNYCVSLQGIFPSRN